MPSLEGRQIIDTWGRGVLEATELRRTGWSIARVQHRDGSIPWVPGGHVDPWDHVESAMGLDVAGLHDRAAHAYRWLAATQRRDGSWAAAYHAGAVRDPLTDANFCAYPAVGVWHHYRTTGDRAFAHEMWPMVTRAMAVVLGLQQPGGEIRWARSRDGSVAPEALLTGCSAMHLSLRCALALAAEIGVAQPDWELAAGALGHAVARRPEVFADRSRFSMDWYYPVLGGAVRGAEARQRLREGWDRFVIEGLGARCVDDRDWITGAETCELALACDIAGEHGAARDLFVWVQHLRDVDGAYWTGWEYDLSVHYPDHERATWTAAAVLLAADALYDLSPAGGLFRGDGLPVGLEPPGLAVNPASI